MARKVLLIYIIYTVLVFLFNSYILKEDYVDALVKSVLSGVVFTALYAIIIMRNEKRQDEEKAAAGKKKK